MGELRYDGRAVVVTGGGRGVGRAHALLLASRGAGVVIADLGAELDGRGSSSGPADEVAREIKELGGEAVATHVSVTDPSGAAAAVELALERFGRLDAVVNNAGISAPAPFGALGLQQYQEMLDVHFFGSLNLIRAAWPHFVEKGYGRIVNTVSEAMLGGFGEMTSYGSAKGAVFGLTRTLATEGVEHGIKVNALAPRAHTRMSADQNEMIAERIGITREQMDEINATMPPDLCAPASAFLAHESCELTGEILQIGMGGVARLAMVASPGISRSPMTPEDIAENLSAVLDLTEGSAPGAEPLSL